MYQTTWYGNGFPNYECRHINGELDGTYKKWYQNGDRELECYYKNGKLHGVYKSWFKLLFPHMQMHELRHYRNGILHGEYKRWLSNGTIDVRCHYRNDMLHGECWYKYFHCGAVLEHGIKIVDLS